MLTSLSQIGIGDIVVSVDDRPVGGDVKLAKQLFLGDAETGVTLGLRRGNGDTAVKNVHLLRLKPLETRTPKEGEVCGIGCTLSAVKDGLAITKIAPGSPAQLSGELQAMDVIGEETVHILPPLRIFACDSKRIGTALSAICHTRRALCIFSA